MNILNIFRPSYYFDTFSGTSFPGFWIVFGVLVAVFCVMLWLGVRWGQDKKATGRARETRGAWLSIGYGLSLIGLLWLFFRYQGIPYLNWRLWPAILLVATAVRAWLVWRGSRLRVTTARSVASSEVSVAEYTRRRRRK